MAELNGSSWLTSACVAMTMTSKRSGSAVRKASGVASGPVNEVAGNASAAAAISSPAAWSRGQASSSETGSPIANRVSVGSSVSGSSSVALTNDGAMEATTCFNQKE